jgi:ribosomal protein L19E
MKKVLLIASFAIVLASCKSSKHIDSDAYKTYYKPVKAERHKHVKCDAYN